MANGNQTFERTEAGFVRTMELVIVRTLSSVAIDAGNTGKTHILRAGLCLAVITASSEYAEYDDTETNGQETGKAILMTETDLRDGDAAASSTDHKAPILVRGHVKSAALHGYDAAFKVDLETTALQIYFD